LMAACALAQQELTDMEAGADAPRSTEVLDGVQQQLTALLESVQAWLRTEPAEDPAQAI